MQWQSSPGAGVWRKRLELLGGAESGRVTSIVRYDAGSRFPPHEHPDAVLMQNRGLFFFESTRPHYQFSTRAAVDFVEFASYRLNTDTWQDFDPYHFADNKFNIVPRLQVEANRADGFQLLSIGHWCSPAPSSESKPCAGRSLPAVIPGL